VANIYPTTWRIKLQQGVKFHDGTPLTVEDVLFSIQRAREAGADVTSQRKLLARQGFKPG
jgi:ABC-type transport system substrate-binding protein